MELAHNAIWPPKQHPKGSVDGRLPTPLTTLLNPSCPQDPKMIQPERVFRVRQSLNS